MLAPNPPRRTFAGKAALWGGALAVAAIYLFATRPAPLADGQAAGRTVPIEQVFRILAAENDAARALWTAEIVGPGPKAGLKFHEKWRDADVAAGPLPALFLRESATAVQKSKVPLGLFLGSDFPISQSNRFTGAQAEHFQRVRGRPAIRNSSSPPISAATARCFRTTPSRRAASAATTSIRSRRRPTGSSRT